MHKNQVFMENDNTNKNKNNNNNNTVYSKSPTKNNRGQKSNVSSEIETNNSPNKGMNKDNSKIIYGNKSYLPSPLPPNIYKLNKEAQGQNYQQNSKYPIIIITKKN